MRLDVTAGYSRQGPQSADVEAAEGRPPAPPDADLHQLVDAVVFVVDGVRGAFPVTAVFEVLRAVTLLPLPDAPPHVEGVIDLRGTLTPVLDVRRRLGMVSRPMGEGDHLLIAAARGRRVALHVDRVLDLMPVLRLGGDDLLAQEDGFAAVGRLEDGLILIQDLDRFLTADEDAALEGIELARAASP